MKKSCSWCEEEFKVPNVALSHGICHRHKQEFLGRPVPFKGDFDPDLSKLTPEERIIASDITAIVKQKDKEKMAKEPLPAE